MLRIYSLNELFLIFYNHFFTHLSNILSKYLVPNIFCTLLTLGIFFIINIVRSTIKSKFFSSLFTIILIFSEVFLLVLFAKEFGIYSLLCSFITIIIIFIEIFKEI